MDTEKKNVRIIVEGKETYQEHDVWFNVAGRESVRARFASHAEDELPDDGWTDKLAMRGY